MSDKEFFKQQRRLYARIVFLYILAGMVLIVSKVLLEAGGIPYGICVALVFAVGFIFGKIWEGA